jgi:DNA-binding NtrC family response regulator
VNTSTVFYRRSRGASISFREGTKQGKLMLPNHDLFRGMRALLLTSRGDASRELVSQLEFRGIRVDQHHVDGNTQAFAARTRPALILIEHTEPCAFTLQELTAGLRSACPSAHLLLVTSDGSEELAVSALRAGMHDYLSLPLSAAAFALAIARCPAPAERPKRAAAASVPTTVMIGDSPAITRIRQYMNRAAASDCTVLITGETGTGKELAAEYIHQQSARHKKPFVCINCAAIPDPLLESEFFGHTRGAFTGANDLRDGLLASAEGGTVLLDEIGDMSLSAQAKILRVLETKEVSRLGGTERRKIDVRFLAATNQDLEDMSNRGAFRRDLYYRLNVARVELPPLRERREDIPLLIDHYRKRQGGPGATEFSPDCLRRLLEYNWPGNIRELKNMIEGILLDGGTDCLGSEQLPRRVRECIATHSDLSEHERELVVDALCSSHWNKSRAAEKLQWSRMTLYRKMAKYNIPHLPASDPQEDV